MKVLKNILVIFLILTIKILTIIYKTILYFWRKNKRTIKSFFKNLDKRLREKYVWKINLELESLL